MLYQYGRLRPLLDRLARVPQNPPWQGENGRECSCAERASAPTLLVAFVAFEMLAGNFLPTVKFAVFQCGLRLLDSPDKAEHQT